MEHQQASSITSAASRPFPSDRGPCCDRVRQNSHFSSSEHHTHGPRPIPHSSSAPSADKHPTRLVASKVDCHESGFLCWWIPRFAQGWKSWLSDRSANVAQTTHSHNNKCTHLLRGEDQHQTLSQFFLALFVKRMLSANLRKLLRLTLTRQSRQATPNMPRSCYHDMSPLTSRSLMAQTTGASTASLVDNQSLTAATFTVYNILAEQDHVCCFQGMHYRSHKTGINICISNLAVFQYASIVRLSGASCHNLAICRPISTTFPSLSRPCSPSALVEIRSLISSRIRRRENLYRLDHNTVCVSTAASLKRYHPRAF